MSRVGYGHGATLRDYLHVVRRRKWIMLLAIVLVPVAAIAFSLHQQKLYQASAQVLLSSQDLAASLTGTPASGTPPDRVAQTQAAVARAPVVAQLVLARVKGTGLTPEEFAASSSVSAAADADILTFDVTNHDPLLARRLVDAYAQAYTVYRRQLDTASIQRALAGVNQRIDELVQAGDHHSPLYASLFERQQTLQTMEALQTANAAVVRRADGVAQTQPKTTRNAILGLVVGIVLGLGLAFLREALDTRVRSAEEIAAQLGVPLLVRVPRPPKKLAAEHGLVMLESPTGTHAETFRMLRTNLDFVSIDRDPRAIMVTSAVEREGKSTTLANLAVALARAGQRVALVDLDLRRPFIDRFFDVAGPGVTGVALGHATLEEALVPIAITDAGAGHDHGTNGNGRGAKPVLGLLEVLPSGPIPPDPGEFVATHALSEILEDLRERADIVLIDAPPVLHVGDAMTLSAKVDAIVVVTRMKVVRRHMLHELSRQLATLPTPVLGFVVTGAGETIDGYYDYGYGYHPRPYEPSEREREGRAASP